MTNLYRYYKGETECPFDRKDAEGDMLSTFWHIEHQYANAMTEDSSFQNRWEMETQEYIQRCNEEGEHNEITDIGRPLRLRALRYYVMLNLEKYRPLNANWIRIY